MRRNHKAQIRISETIAVLFIFFVLVFFGMVFYYKYSQIAFEERQGELLSKRAMEITLKALYMPELVCSRGEAEPEDSCFDLMKLEKAKEVFNEHQDDYYFDLFSYTTLTVKQLYPEVEGGKEWVLYKKEKPEWERKETTYFVAALKDERSREREGEVGLYNLGVLTVEVYS